MNRKDFWLGGAAIALALWALWPAWLDARLFPANYGDLPAYHYPMRHLVVESLQGGKLPFWNPYIFSGVPLAANPQATLFYPVTALAAFFPLTLAFSWDFLFHLIWALLGAGLLFRRAGLSAAAAWTAAILYAFSPMAVYRIVEGIPTLLASLSWVPWCWLAWLSGRSGALALVWALQLLSGHPQFLIINAVGMGVWALFEKKPVERWLGLAVEGAGALLLTIVQWAPTAEFLGRSVRRAWPAAYALGYSLEPEKIFTLISPAAFGDPIARTWSGPPSVFFETCSLWIGAVGLACAAAGFLCRRRKIAPAALIACGLLLALGAHGPLGAAGLSLLRTPSRWLLLAVWGLLLAAGSGLNWAGRHGGRRVAALLFSLAAIELAAWDGRFLGTTPAVDSLKPSRAFADLAGGSRWRLITDPELANPNKTALYHARNANGYEAFYLDGYPQYVARSEGKAAADASRTYLSRLDTPEMDRLSVMWKLGATGVEKRAEPHLLAFFDGRNGAERSYPKLNFARAERWRVEGRWIAGAERIVLSQPSYPGWNAWLDGHRVALDVWDDLLQAAPRPIGARDGEAFTLDLRFIPTHWTLWLCLSVAALYLWLRRSEAWI